jgi:hypothetical protein
MRGLRRVARALFLIVLAVEVTWLVVGNGVLVSHAVPRLLRWAQNSIDMDYRRAWSFFPGDLNVRDYWIRGRTDQAFQFRFDAERVHAQVSLLALCRRTFKATHVRASGLRVAFRKLIDNTERPADGEQLSLLPPIEGYDPVPAKILGPGEPIELALATHGFWHLDLEDVRVEHVRELWMQQLHWQGDGEVDGRVLMHPRTHLEYGPSTLTLREGAVRIGDQVLLEQTHGTFNVTIAPLVPEQLVKAEMLRFISGRMQLEANVKSLEALEPMLGRRAQGKGTVAMNVIIDRGVLADGSTFLLPLEEARVQAGPLRIAGKATFEGNVKGHAGSLEVTMPAPRISLVSTPDARLEGGVVRVGVQVSRLDLVSSFGPISPLLELHGLHTASLPPWNAFLPRALALKDGVVSISGKLDLGTHEKAGHGALELDARRIELAVKGEPIAGSLKAEIPVKAFVLAPLGFDCSGTTIRIDADHAKGLGKEADGWWADVALPTARMSLQPELVVEGEVAVHARSGKPLLALLGQLGAIPGVVKDLFLLPDLKMGGHGTLAGGTLRLSGLHADGGRGHFAAALRLREALDAALLVNVPVATVGVEVAAGKPKLHLLEATQWYGTASKALEVPEVVRGTAHGRLPTAR